MVWHSQCAQEAFCKGYKPVTIPTDPEKLKENPRLKFFERLDPVCFVDRDTMLKRLESYIHSLVEYMYREGYASTIYAWDVVNEAIELADKTETGLRNSYWYQVIGDDFIYWAFRYANEAVAKYSAQYASAYGIDAGDLAALKTIQPVLVYNDYNECMPEKRERIVRLIRELQDKKVVFFDVGYTLDMPASGDWMFTNRFLAEAGNALKKIGQDETNRAGDIALHYLAENHLVTTVDAEIAQFHQYYSII